jgi:PAS domain S-box-containing protein
MKRLLDQVLDLAHRQAAKAPDMLVELYTVHDERLIWASPSHRQILGYDPEELVGIHWKDIVDHTDHAHKAIMLQDALLTGGSMEIGFNIIAKSGARRYVKVVDTLYTNPNTEDRYVICRTTHIAPPTEEHPTPH